MASNRVVTGDLSNVKAMTLYFFLKTTGSLLVGPCVCCAEFDIQMEVMNSYVAHGDILQSAYLLDEEGMRTDLPVEAFDGSPMTGDIQNLTKEYQQLLRVLY